MWVGGMLLLLSLRSSRPSLLALPYLAKSISLFPSLARAVVLSIFLELLLRQLISFRSCSAYTFVAFLISRSLYCSERRVDGRERSERGKGC